MREIRLRTEPFKLRSEAQSVEAKKARGHGDRFVEIAQIARSAQVDASGLSEALRSRIRGEVRFDRGSRALYATDGSNYRQVPIGVVLPRDADDVIATVALCRDFGAPLLCRGGGTSLAGQCCNVAVVLDFSRYMAGFSKSILPAESPAYSLESCSIISAPPLKNTISPLRPIRPRMTAALSGG